MDTICKVITKWPGGGNSNIQCYQNKKLSQYGNIEIFTKLICAFDVFKVICEIIISKVNFWDNSLFTSNITIKRKCEKKVFF